MAEEDSQARADADETSAAERFVRLQRIASDLTEARRRAEAMSRLETALRVPHRR